MTCIKFLRSFSMSNIAIFDILLWNQLRSVLIDLDSFVYIKNKMQCELFNDNIENFSYSFEAYGAFGYEFIQLSFLQYSFGGALLKYFVASWWKTSISCLINSLHCGLHDFTTSLLASNAPIKLLGLDKGKNLHWHIILYIWKNTFLVHRFWVQCLLGPHLSKCYTFSYEVLSLFSFQSRTFKMLQFYH